MSHSSPTTEPPAPRNPADAGTREIAVDPTASTTTGTRQLPRVEPEEGRPDGIQPTGPVGSLPGLPATGAPPPAPAPAEHPAEAPRPARPPHTPQERAALLATGLTALALVLLHLGLAAGFGTASLWSTVPLWSVFAALAALVGALPAAARLLPARLRPDAAWQVAAGGLTGVAVFWVLVVLPRVDSDRGFVLTAALAALGAALWAEPGRTRG